MMMHIESTELTFSTALCVWCFFSFSQTRMLPLTGGSFNCRRQTLPDRAALKRHLFFSLTENPLLVWMSIYYPCLLSEPIPADFGQRGEGLHPGPVANLFSEMTNNLHLRLYSWAI